MSRPFKPDFEQFQKMIAGETPDRPVIFEHYVDPIHINRALGDRRIDQDNPPWGWVINGARGYAALGYDCIGIGDHWAKFLQFPRPEREHGHSIGQYSAGLIRDEASMESYPWPEPDLARAQMMLDGIARDFPGGMKLTLTIGHGPYDMMVELMGFETVCIAAIDEPELLDEVARRIGEREVRLVEACAGHPVIGAIQICDDWGYKTDTVLSPETLRRSVFPWHGRITETAHAAGKFAILHACGDVSDVMDDVIDSMGFDAKHSYEDVICPVEEVCRKYGGRIAILGGLDVDYLARSTPEEIYSRCRKLIEMTGGRRYAVGSGNSVTPDVSWEKYMAMLQAAWDGMPR